MWISLNVIVNFHFTLLHEKRKKNPDSSSCGGDAGSSEALLECLLWGRVTRVFGGGAAEPGGTRSRCLLCCFVPIALLFVVQGHEKHFAEWKFTVASIVTVPKGTMIAVLKNQRPLNSITDLGDAMRVDHTRTARKNRVTAAMLPVDWWIFYFFGNYSVRFWTQSLCAEKSKKATAAWRRCEQPQSSSAELWVFDMIKKGIIPLHPLTC